jgi:hypothetical protein
MSSHEATLLVPSKEQIQRILAPVEQLPLPAEAMPRPSPEQVQATEAVFVQSDQDADHVARMVGLWTSALLLHDIAVETFDPPADEKEEKAKPEPKAN